MLQFIGNIGKIGIALFFCKNDLFLLENCIPPEHWPKTGVSLLATAGMRKISEDQQDWVLSVAREAIQDSHFQSDSVCW